MKKLSNLIIVTLMAFSVSVLPLISVASATYAAEGDDAFCTEQLKNSNPAKYEFLGCNLKKDAAETTVQNIVNIVIGVMGVAATVFIVRGGIDYMTANGNPDKLKRAKHTILYAAIGLVICILSFAIVNWVISGVETSTTPAPTTAP